MTDIPIEILEIRWALEELGKDAWRKYTQCDSVLGDDGSVGTISRVISKVQSRTPKRLAFMALAAVRALTSVAELADERVEFESRWTKEVVDVNTHLIQQFLHIVEQAKKLLRTSISDD